jgi:hypothetical protein
MHVGTSEVIPVRRAAQPCRAARGASMVSVGAAAALALSSIVFATAPTARAAAPAQVGKHSTWSLEPMTPRGDLSASSCVTADFCVAVGAEINDDGEVVGGVEVWNGSTWKSQPTLHQPGADYTELTGVSCTSVTACTAVGDFYSHDLDDEAPLAEVWNGSTWTVTPTVNPAGTTQALLNSVSCISANACTAAGYYYNNSDLGRPLVEAWNGAKWTTQDARTAPGSEASFLYGVSCRSVSLCTAVGDAFEGSNVPLVETWNGKIWSVIAVPNPGGGVGGILLAVACASTSACTAVGYSGNARTLVEGWNGGTWAIVPSPNVKGGAQVFFTGVSCSTPTLCTAVGSSVTRHNIESMLVAAGTDNIWTLQTTESVTPAESWLNGVSCVAPTVCHAVGASDLSAHDFFLAEGEGS